MSSNCLRNLGFPSILKKWKHRPNTFFTKGKIFHYNLKAFVKTEPEIEKWNDYDKITELSNFCQKLIAEYEKSVGLKEIGKITDQRKFINTT